MPKSKLVPVSAEEVRLGTALPFPLFDTQGTLLLAPGDVLQNLQQLTAMQAFGLYTLADWQPEEASTTSVTMHAARQHPVNSRLTVDFATLKLQPDCLLYLRQLDSPSSALIPVRLRAWQEGEDLHVTAVSGHEPAWDLEQGAIMDVRLLVDKLHVVSFQTAIRVRSQRGATTDLALTCPASVAVRQLRRSLRVGVSLPVQIGGAEDLEFQDGTMVNLGTEGCQVELPQLIAEKGDEVLLVFALSEAGVAQPLQSVRSVVRNQKVLGGDLPMVQYGLEFTDLDEVGRLEIECFIFQALTEGW